jgi:hypothetical protein
MDYAACGYRNRKNAPAPAQSTTVFVLETVPSVRHIQFVASPPDVEFIRICGLFGVKAVAAMFALLASVVVAAVRDTVARFGFFFWLLANYAASFCLSQRRRAPDSAAIVVPRLYENGTKAAPSSPSMTEAKRGNSNRIDPAYSQKSEGQDLLEQLLKRAIRKAPCCSNPSLRGGVQAYRAACRNPRGCPHPKVLGRET